MWDKGIIGHFIHQHTFNIAWTPGRTKDLFSLDPVRYDRGALKDVRSQVTNHASMRMSPKQNNSPSWGSSKTSQIQLNLILEDAFRSKWWPVSSAKVIIWRLFHLGIVGQSILSGTPQFVWLKSSRKFEKRTREDESLFTMTMRALTHRLNWWVNHRTDLNWHPMSYTDFGKAFDRVNHSFLLAKLQLIDLNPKLLKWISSYLSDRSQKVIFKNQFSDTLKVFLKVLILAPFFSIFL